MSRPDIFPLKVVQPMALLRFDGMSDGQDGARMLFGYLQENAVDTPFVLEEPAPAGVRNLILALDQGALEKDREILSVLQEISGARELVLQEPVAMIRIFGPHFDIRPGIAALLFCSLSKAGIDVLASSTTITSTLLVVPESQTDSVVRQLGIIFRLPKSS